MDVKQIKSWGFSNVYKAAALLCDWMNRDENMQVNGVVFVVDLTGLSMSKMTAVWNPEFEKKMSEFFQVIMSYDPYIDMHIVLFLCKFMTLIHILAFVTIN